jgi:hypothetical protein
MHIEEGVVKEVVAGRLSLQNEAGSRSVSASALDLFVIAVLIS